MCSNVREAEKWRNKLDIAEIDTRMQHFQQIYDQTVQDALREIDTMVCLRVSEKINKN